MVFVCFAFEDGRDRCISEQSADLLAKQLRRRISVEPHVAELADEISVKRSATGLLTSEQASAIETTPEQKQSLMEALGGGEWPEEDADALAELRLAARKFGPE